MGCGYAGVCEWMGEAWGQRHYTPGGLSFFLSWAAPVVLAAAARHLPPSGRLALAGDPASKLLPLTRTPEVGGEGAARCGRPAPWSGTGRSRGSGRGGPPSRGTPS